ncbi:MAG: T9SS C-terminal target domain-containing protein [Calditrichaeota bacterium]|nr:MAG: T9SS C-terminal target domain-containing protein [Calditrichota bacterium]
MNSQVKILFSFFLFIFLALFGHENAYGISVKMTQPRNGARFERCADIVLKAEADIPDAQIKRIIFNWNLNTVKSVRTAPWESTIEDVADGIYEVYAKLTDTNNQSTTSDTIQVFVGSILNGEMLKNGEFGCGIAPWTLSLAEGASAQLLIDPEGYLSDESSMAVIEIENPGTANWHVMMVQSCPLDSGHTYEVYFSASVEKAKNIGVDFQSTSGTYPVHFWQTVELTEDTFEYGPIEFFSTVTDHTTQFKLALSEDNTSVFFDAIQVIDKNWVKNTTDVDEQPPIVVRSYGLLQNDPNPFNPQTDIKFVAPRNGWVNLSIYNVKGQLIKTLVNAVTSEGSHTIRWDGMDDDYLPVPSGVYIYRLATESFTSSKRMLLIK